jgi:serine protease Do
MLTVALAACGGGPAATATPVSIATERAIAQPTTPPTTIPSPPPPTATPPPPTATPLPPTATSAPTATPTIKPTEKPSATPTPAPHAIVTSETLNIRSGPNTQYDVITRVAKGDALTVVGQTDQCNWLRILTAQNVVGWVARRSGGAELVQLNLPCAEIPAVSVPSPTPRPTVRPQPTQPPAPAQGGLPADKGCYLFQNFMGAELNVTFNNGHGWSDNFKIAPNAERLYCLVPDHYTYTIDAPPWASISGSLDVQAGKHYRFPIQGRP